MLGGRRDFVENLGRIACSQFENESLDCLGSIGQFVVFLIKL